MSSCHPGQDDTNCECDSFNGLDRNLTLNTYWNSTVDSCTFEYTLPGFTDIPVESWKLEIESGYKSEIEGIWRANDFDKQANSYSHIVYPMYFNPNGLHTDLTFQLTADTSCDTAHWPMLAESLEFEYCSEELQLETSTVMIYETAPPAVTAPPEEVIQLGEKTCNPVVWDGKYFLVKTFLMNFQSLAHGKTRKMVFSRIKFQSI